MSNTNKNNTNKNKNNNKNNNKNKNSNNSKFLKDIYTPIGILDPEGKYKNPLTNEPYTEGYFEGSKFWSQLPMYKVREKALKVMHEHQVTLIVSGTGSGKTVLTPKFMLHLLKYKGKVVVTIPKQAPVREAATYARDNLDVKMGEHVGYKYRGSPANSASKQTNLLYATDGLILEKLKRSDPLLKEFDAVIIDEAHERNVRIDFLLLLLKRVLRERPDLKLIIMSATIDEKVFLDYYKEFNIGHFNAGEESNYPVEQHFLTKPVNQFDENANLVDNERPPKFIQEAVKKVVHILTTTDTGDILVFLTGSGDLSDGCMLLNQEMKKANAEIKTKVYCAPLKGGLTDSNKDYAISNVLYKDHPNGPFERKVVMATDVAESSITVKNLDFVVDTGLANVDKFYSNKNMTALEKVYITKAQHKQRAGRTGRQKEGTCYNIFTEEEYEKQFREFPEPPVLQEDLTEQVLNLLAADYITNAKLPFVYPKNSKNNNQKGGANNNKNNRENFINMSNNVANKNIKVPPQSLNEILSKLITPPKPNFIENSLRLLFALGALSFDKEEKTLTISPLGEAMSKFSGIPAQMARAIIASYTYMCRDQVVEIAALTEISGNQMDQIIYPFKVSPRVKKMKDKSEQMRAEKEERNRYEKALKQWINPYGDHIALLRIYQAYKARAYDKTRRDPQTGENVIIEPKLGNVKEWCKENFIKDKKMGDVKNRVREYSQKLKYIISNSKRHQYGGASRNQNQNLVNIETTSDTPEARQNQMSIANILHSQPKLHDKLEDNILQALMEGYHVNTGINTWKQNYISCFPKEHVMGTPGRDSLFQYMKPLPKLIFAEELRSIFGRVKYNIVSKVPDKVLKDIPKQRMKLCLEAELKMRKESKQQGNKQHGQKRDQKHGQKRDQKHGKKRGRKQRHKRKQH